MRCKKTQGKRENNLNSAIAENDAVFLIADYGELSKSSTVFAARWQSRIENG